MTTTNSNIPHNKVKCLNSLCRYRPCYKPHKDYGSYTPGRGYKTHKNAAENDWLCLHRDMHGCPDEIPEVDNLEIINQHRCCYAPLVRNNRKAKKQKCLTCGQMLANEYLKLVRDGKVRKLFPCTHLEAEEDVLPQVAKYSCKQCYGGFNYLPKPYARPDVIYWVQFRKLFGPTT